jgi:glycosyltransferase involved in cell wall biosynthesis
MSLAEPSRVDLERVPVMTVLPADPERMAIGGIASFVRGFVKFAPHDFALSFVGVSPSREPWRWHEVELEGRQIAFLPVARADPRRRSRLPIALRFTAALLAHPRARRRLVPTDRAVVGFHRPATDLGLGRWSGPRWRVVHLSVQDLATPGSESRWRRGSKLLSAVERLSFRHMDRIYVVNEQVAGRYRRRYPDVADRIQFIPNWADPTIFHPVGDAERERLRTVLSAELGLPMDASLILFAARLEGQKDPLLLARAFGQLRASAPDAYLLVAGDGSLRQPMRAELTAAGVVDAVRFLGVVSRPRLAELMRGSDALAITSAFETGPTVGLEALACGLPVATTPVGEVARLVSSTGAGHTADDRSVAAVARSLAEVIHQRDALTVLAASAAAPFLADGVLGPFYEDNRRLAARLPGPVALPPRRMGDE